MAPLRRALVTAATVLILGAAVAAQSVQTPDRIERRFAPGGKVFLKLSAGTYRIEGSPDPLVRLRWRSRPGDRDRVRVRIDTKPGEATVLTKGPSKDFEVDLEIPQRSDLVLRLTAGDLRVRGIEGSKDIDLWAGDVLIEIGDPEQYRHVLAAVRAGQITATPFRIDKGGLFRSFEHDGRGRYELKVKLFAGDLELLR